MEALIVNKSLTSLNMAKNDLGKMLTDGKLVPSLVGFDALCSTLATNSTLVILNIQSNVVETAGARKLSHALSSSYHSLKEFTFSGDKSTSKLVRMVITHKSLDVAGSDLGIDGAIIFGY